MKVLCIDASLRANEYDSAWNISEGKIYTVSGKFVGFDLKDNRYSCYKLSEDPQQWSLWDVDRFIPLSDLEEQIGEYKEEIIYA